MTSKNIIDDLNKVMSDLRGDMEANVPLAQFTSFKVGGPAQVLFGPIDESDLCYFLSRLPLDIDVTMLGLGFNVLIRDRGIDGVVVRFGRRFRKIQTIRPDCLLVGGGAPNGTIARRAMEAQISGFEFLCGIPGTIGGSLRMNSGCYGSDVSQLLVWARAVDRNGNVHTLDRDRMQFAYRYCGAPEEYIFVETLLKGRLGDQAEIGAKMEDIQRKRADEQPIAQKTCGSTFKNPSTPGSQKAWELIDASDCRELQCGGARVSSKHCNFLINQSEATAGDIETLGENVRQRVRLKFKIDLQWEIRLLGAPDQ